MGYRLTNKASEDIENIFQEGIEKFGLSQAIGYIDDLEKCFEFLSANPKICRQRFEIFPPLRVHLYQAHLVFFEIIEDDILIVRVRHGHEDWEQKI
jgi:toxin ParE1/3/4